MTSVQFIYSAGLGALLSIREQSRQLGIEMALVNVFDPAQRSYSSSGTRPRRRGAGAFTSAASG